MLVELSVMEQRYQAVLAVVQDGWKVTEVAAAPRRLAPERARLDRPLRGRRSRRARRPLASAERAARTRSRPRSRLRSASCAASTRAGDRGGSSTSSPGDGVDPVPRARPSTGACKRHGLIELRRRRKRRDEFRRWERERPMQLWQMDVMGGVLLDDGTELKVVTGDRRPQPLLRRRRPRAAGRPPRPCAACCSPRCAATAIPDEILTDNGKVFTGRFGPQPVGGAVRPDLPRERHLPSPHRRALADHHRQDRAVPPEPAPGVPGRPHASPRSRRPRPSSTPGSPTTTPNRPHQALEMATPAERFRLRPLAKDAASVPVDAAEDHAGQWVLRRVGLQRRGLGGQPAVLGRQRLQGRARGRVRRRDHDPGLEQEPPDQDRRPDRDRGPCARSEPTACTSSISRIRSVKHQVALDTRSSLLRRSAPLRLDRHDDAVGPRQRLGQQGCLERRTERSLDRSDRVVILIAVVLVLLIVLAILADWFEPLELALRLPQHPASVSSPHGVDLMDRSPRHASSQRHKYPEKDFGLEGCCQTGCRQGRVGRVLSDPPQQLGERPRALGPAAAGLASCGRLLRGSGRPWPARGVPGRGTPPASRPAAPAARASRGGRGSGGAGDPTGGVLSAGRGPRGPSPSLRRVGDWGGGGAPTWAGAATDSSGVNRSRPARGTGRVRGGTRPRASWRGVGRSQWWRLGLRRCYDWGRGSNR